MAKGNQKSLYLVAMMFFLGGVGWLLYSGLTENSVYFLNVSEALAAPKEKLSAMRLFGTVAERDLAPFEGAPGVRFRLEDKDNKEQSILVQYRGAVPDTFKPGAEVIVEGAMSGGAFSAKTLMTKCPSKYQKENRS